MSDGVTSPHPDARLTSYLSSLDECKAACLEPATRDPFFGEYSCNALEYRQASRECALFFGIGMAAITHSQATPYVDCTCLLRRQP